MMTLEYKRDIRVTHSSHETLHCKYQTDTEPEKC